MRIPFIDLKAQYHSIKDELDSAIADVVENASFALGPAVSDFEASFADYVGVNHVIGVNSGTSALHLALLSVGIGAGDEVIAPAMTFIATVSAIEYTGARPVLVDVDPVSYTMDPSKLEQVITEKTKAIVPVHLYGQCADMDPILEIARGKDVFVIEDAAQAHGAKYKNLPAGCIGDLAAFSFYPSKNLGAYGEAGAVATCRDESARIVRMLRDWGSEKKHQHELRGFNYRMDGIQGAVLGVKLRYIEQWTEARRGIAERYRELLADIEEIVLPVEREGNRHVYYVFAILVKNRDTVAAMLQREGISVGIHHPRPVHLIGCFSDLGYSEGAFPTAEKIGREELSLPIYPELTSAQNARVADSLRSVLR